MTDLIQDLKNGSEWTVTSLNQLGINLDYSIDSLKLIENLLSEQFESGQPKKGGLFESEVGGKLFAIGAYLGEVIIRNSKNVHWKPDPKDLDNDFTVMIESLDGAIIWPQQKLFKRINDGDGDNIYFYASAVIKSFNEEK